MKGKPILTKKNLREWITGVLLGPAEIDSLEALKAVDNARNIIIFMEENHLLNPDLKSK